MTAKPFKPAVRGIMRAAIWTGGAHSRVCRCVKYDTRTASYAVYRAIGGRLGRRLVQGQGSPADALLHGCAVFWAIDMPGVWKTKGVTK
jgi:hypothetical protein